MYDLLGRPILIETKRDIISGGGIIDDLRELFKYKTKYEGERHGMVHDPNNNNKLTIGNYLGPGTQVLLRQQKDDTRPINDLDSAAKRHDYSYLNIKNKYDENKDKKAFKEAIWKADDEFIKKARQSKDDVGLGKLSASLISKKKTLEKVGILPTSLFSGVGNKKPKKKPYPDFILQMIKNNKKQVKKSNKNSK